MLAPPRLEYYGDIEKASTLKGAALAFYQFVCSSMGEAQSIQREKRNDTTVMQATIWTAYGEKRGVVKIYVAPVGSEGEAVLFPTSFNDTDLGTQIYKAPYPAKKQGDLILADDNPNYLVLPTPTYSARTNYWVNDKENATVSWDYVEYLDTSFPVGHINRKRKYGKIAINGIETGLLWGKFLEPLACALIEEDSDGTAVEQIVIIYHDRVDYAETGLNRYIGVFGYELDFNASDIVLTEIIESDFTALGYSENELIGFFGDAKRLAIHGTVDRIYYPADHPYGITIHVPTINTLEFNPAYDGILTDEIIYESQPWVSDGYNEASSDGVTTLIVPTENISCDYVDIRGGVVSFAVEKTASDVQTITEATAPYFTYYPLQTKVGASEYYLVSWSKKDGLNRDLLATSSSNWQSTQTLTSGDTGLITSVVSDATWTYIALFLKKVSECIYSDVSQQHTSMKEEGTLPSGDYGVISETSITTTALSVISKKSGVLYTSDKALTEAFVDDYSYTKNTMVATINTYDVVDGDSIDKSFTLIADFKDKKRKIVEQSTTCISLTKLPKPS